jgi:hypothetical protein
LAIKEYTSAVENSGDIFSHNRLKNKEGEVDRFEADVRITCIQCGVPFRFIGLPAGLDLNGAATNPDATEARLAIAPKGAVVSFVDGAPLGFSIRRVQ